ncbi:RNA recognition motif domain-containing protein [Pendulispora albinea]|uniref:RNA-binding protein n=1 Tax=Pendulispora albinea TaxID=2741071 RepID=A0ABZ2LS51_9BACT
MGNRLYVGNLPFQADAAWLRSTFSASGDVTDVQLVSDRETGQSRGYAFVTMSSEAAASKAIANMNGSVVNGRTLKVNTADARPNPRGGDRAQDTDASRRKSR